MDVLTDVLMRARAEGAIFAHSTLRGRWGLDFGADSALSLHTVLAGEFWCEVAGKAPVRVGSGSLLLLTGGAPFRLLSAPGVVATPIAEMLSRHAVAGQDGVLELAGAGPATELLCGAYTFSGIASGRLLRELPELSVVSGGDPVLQATLDLLRTQVHSSAVGRQVVLDRLLDVLLIGCLRELWGAGKRSSPGWVSALHDPVVSEALRAMHSRPAHSWTVGELATASGVSRASLARRFQDRVGTPPLTYLTRWRMELAQEALRASGSTLAQISREVGYADPYAFAAAFKREVGTAPGRWRALAG